MNGRGDAEVHTLTGAYALDALGDDEREAFERHLTECESCAREVVELRETAARLGGAATAEPPHRLRSAVFERITEVRQEPPDTLAVARRRRVRATPLPRLSTAAAAVLLVVATALGVLLVQERNAVQDSQRQAEAVASILHADDAELARQSSAGTRMTLVMSRSQDRMLVLADNLPAAPSGHDYQAWALGTHTRSAGLLTPHDGRVFLEAHGIAAAERIGITIEPTGGSEQPTTEPIMLFELR